MDRASRPEGNVTDIQEGWDVYDADEEKVGNVDRVEQGYVVAHKGIFFPKDLYIPTSAIERIEHDRVYLHVAKGDADAEGWDAPPTAGAASGGPPPKPDAVGTPGLTGTAEEGGRPVRASGGDTTASAGRGVGAAAGNAAVPLETTGTTAGAAPRSAGPVGTTDGDQALHLHEEELRVSKERVQAGQVRLGKEVVEEERTLDVPTTREEVVIERTPSDRQPDDHTIEDSADETIRVPVAEERVTVEKVPVVTEEVSLGKRQITETRQVSDTVRREEARIDQTGDVDVAGAATPGWDAAAARFRTTWEQGSGAQGGRWEDVEPGYRYGWQMANDPRYRGRSWADAEPALREDWASAHPETPWERAGAAIREAWDSVTARA